MSKKTNKKEQITGWFEVIYRNEGAAIPSGLNDINARDYTMVDAPFPMSEFEWLFDVVEMFLKPRANVRRAIQEFDVISFFKTEPTQGSNTLILIQPSKLKQFGFDGGQYHTAAFTDLILVPTRPSQRFAPFRYKK